MKCHNKICPARANRNFSRGGSKANNNNNNNNNTFQTLSPGDIYHYHSKFNFHISKCPLTIYGENTILQCT